jgi:hypothetical protein
MQTRSLLLPLIALLAIGCSHLSASGGTARDGVPPSLKAHGPGAVFPSVDEAAVDALTYAYLQGHAANSAEQMRGGTIQRSGDGYSYSEIHVANARSAHWILYTLAPQDVARFQIYPRVHDHDVNRVNERLSRVDRRTVSFIDPLHRTLYVLHPSLSIRAYRGEDSTRFNVANLITAEPALAIAGN